MHLQQSQTGLFVSKKEPLKKTAVVSYNKPLHKSVSLIAASSRPVKRVEVPRRCDTVKSRALPVRSAVASVSTTDAPAKSRAPKVPVATPPAVEPRRLAQQDGLNARPGREVRIFYNSGWEKAVLHYSAAGQGWKDAPFASVISGGGRWLVATVELPSDAGSAHGATPLVEFVVTNGCGDWDKPPRGSNYAVVHPGRYVLSRGEVSAVDSQTPSSSASPSSKGLAKPPVLVVSDLDGTMVGDDARTAAFRQWWEKEGVPRGGVLAFNTGRALPSVQELLRTKVKCLATPDVIISAVGTKIYELDPSSSTWAEVSAWTRVLDERWSLEAVRDVAYRVLASVGREAMHFRPPEELNEHKVTCGVRDDVAAKVVRDLERELADAGVGANVISSGHGGWKYVDIVPLRAGKLEALEFVRRRFGFPVGQTVACGDSGNDILMLNGANRAVAVGNSQPDLKQWIQSQPREVPTALEGAGGADARNARVRLLQAAAPEALGILEAMEFWGFK